MKKTEQTLRVTVLFVLFAAVVFLNQMGLLTGIDYWIYEQAREQSLSKLWLQFWLGVTYLGNGQLVYAVIGFALLVFVLRVRKNWAGQYLIVMTALFLANTVAKLIFGLERPVSLAPFYPGPSTYSFPSGHAFNAVILFYFTPHFMRKAFQSMTEGYRFALHPVFAVLMIMSVAASRLFLGVHWFSDVLAGVLLGALASVLGLMLFDWMSLSHEKVGETE